MVVFKLESFPFVCRMCLKPATKDGMISLDRTDPLFDGSVQDFITAVTFVFEDSKASLLPQLACQKCFELLKFFAKFRLKLLNMHLFINSLIELKGSNSAPMIDLFRSKPDQLAILFKDLDLCTKPTVYVEDLLNEFGNYRIAKMEDSDDEKKYDVQVEDPSKNDSAIYAEECTADELAELIPQPLLKEMKRKGSGSVKNKDQKIDSLFQAFSNIAKQEGCDPAKPKRKRRNVLLNCEKCKYTTYYPQHMRGHQDSHKRKENRKYACPYVGCSEVLPNARARKKHFENVHKPHVCDICGIQFATQSGLSTHKKRHLNLLDHCCEYCGHRANTKQDLRHHVNIQHNADYIFPCEICGLQFKRKSIMKEHMETHANERKYKCTRCDKSFIKSATLKRHRKTVHENVRIPCDHCPRTFLRREVQRDHIEYVHGIQIRFICDICVQLFFDKDSLARHKLRHSNPKELECGTCLAVFPSTDLRENHLCISYRDDYICCGRDFFHHYNYNKHMFIKHGVRANARVKPDPNHLVGYLRCKRKRIEHCPHCEATFTTRNLKKQHLETCMPEVKAVVAGDQVIEETVDFEQTMCDDEVTEK
ncbi:zinc finger protein 141-like [Sabethes cyaneus]|uniref:zinc finger protein 141-like n=1 Tax=Sabethes cyaneus TaxID=53552 RepID=UPI00237EAEE7|nr:zinc finger protein 141-like [Sabethes cyaneus]